MGHIIQPDKIGLVVCPNEHPDDDVVVINDRTTNAEIEMFVIRLIVKTSTEKSEYLYPPVPFVLAALSRFFKEFPSIPIWVGEKKCAACMGFDTPTLWRKAYREKPFDPFNF